MRSINGTILQKMLAIEAGRYVWLIELVASDDDATTFRYARNPTAVTFGGAEYEAYAFDPQVLGGQSAGAPRYTLKLANLGDELSSYLYPVNHLDQATITISIVDLDNLTLSHTDLQTTYTVHRASRDADGWLVLEIGGHNLVGERFPTDRFYSAVGDAPFKGARCGYVGGYLSCDRTLSACRTRGNSNRFCGFAAMRSRSLRLTT